MNLHRTSTLILVAMLVVLAGFTLSASQVAFTNQQGENPSGYVVARVYYTGKSDLDQLATRLDIWEVNQKEGYLVAMLSPAQFSELEAGGYRLEIDQKRTDMLYQPMIASPDQSPNTIPGYPCYRTVEETYTSLQALATDHPDLVQISNIGDSWDQANPGGPAGYSIYALRMTNFSLGNPDTKPTFFLMAEIHAREYVTAETATRFAEYLIDNYGTDADVTWLLDYYQVYVVAMTNPDGRKFAESGIMWRKNTDTVAGGGCGYPNYGVDLNRNNPFHWGGAGTDPCGEVYQGPSGASEPETQNINDLVLTLFPDQRGPGDSDPAPADTTGVFITLHSAAGLVLWPWGWTPTDAPNHGQLQTLGRRLAYFNNYIPQQSNDLYGTTGTSDDWAYGELGIAAYTYEMGTEFFQDCAIYESVIHPDNLQSLLYAFTSARLPYMNPSGPDSLNALAQPAGAVPGTIITLTANADDTQFNNSNGSEPTQNISAARYSIDSPSWITGTATYSMTASDGAFDSTVELVEAFIDTTGFSYGRHTIFIESQDASGYWGVTSSLFFYIIDPAVAPVIEGYVTSADSGSPITATISAGIFSVNSDPATGYYSMTVISDTYDIQAYAEGFAPATAIDIQAFDYQIIRQDFSLYGFCEIFSDDVELGNQGWATEDYWGITSQYSHSPSNSWTDSPDRLYYNFMDSSITSQEFDLTNFTGVNVSFWTRYQTETGYDFGYVEYWDGTNWVTAGSYDGTQTTWMHAFVPLPGMDSNANARFRFRFFSDVSVTGDGWYIDDIVLQGGGPGCVAAPTSTFTFLPMVAK
jgi:carboxypeptidase T